MTQRQLCRPGAPAIDSSQPFSFNRRMSDATPPRANIFARMAGTAYIAGIGGELTDLGAGRAGLRLPYSERLVGDPQTGIVHGGVITGCLDHCCGIAVASALRNPMPFATLDLRIDYMKAAVPHAEIFFEAECLKVTHEIAFTRGLAWQQAREVPIALCTGTFMLIRGAPFPNLPEASNG